MTKQEFEARYGKRVTDEEFDFINEAYMAAGDIDKDTFCAEWRMHGLGESMVVKALADLALLQESSVKAANAELVEQLAELRYQLAELREQNDKLLSALLSEEAAEAAVDIVGREAVILRRLEADLPLSDDDKSYLAQMLKPAAQA